jgi:hypothetical protein
MLRFRVTLTYDADAVQDGSGAQIQRLIGIRAVAERYRLGYLHTEIKNLTITQLDPFQTPRALSRYLTKLNNRFYFSSTSKHPYDKEIWLTNLSRKEILNYVLFSFIKNESILLHITMPYHSIDHRPDLYKLASKKLEWFSSHSYKDNVKKMIVIHLRLGADPKHIDPGKSFPRSLSLHYYEKILNELLSSDDFNKQDYEIVILTDAPEMTTFYPIQGEFQRKQWAEAGYRIKNGKTKITGFDLKRSAFANYEGLRIIRGGDPLRSIELMAQADVLIMSKSSFSYVGGILNEKGIVYYPARFWHPPLSSWIIKTEDLAK